MSQNRPHSLTRRQVLALLDQEREYILAQAHTPGADPPIWSFEDLSWYLGLARNWGLLALYELARNQPPGDLLDVGTFYSLLSGAATRLGWRASGVDMVPVPNYSGLASRGARIELCNICIDRLPFDSDSQDAIFFLEVLEHLPYSPAPAFSEMRRLLRPNGRVYLSTPNAAGMGRIRLLMMGRNHEPSAEAFLKEDDPVAYKGLTFFRSGREHRLWTMGELEHYLPAWGFRIVDRYFYNTTVYDSNFPSLISRAAAAAKFWSHPFIRRMRLLGGGLFIIAEPQK
jgi:SAM-dependent methyltransferase